MIVFDEPTSALDVTVQAQILDLLRVLMADGTRSYVFVAHDRVGRRKNCCEKHHKDGRVTTGPLTGRPELR